jgi:hypothetical protein
MSDDKEIFTAGFSRRSFLTAAGAVGAGAALAPLLGGAADARAEPARSTVGVPVTTPRVNGLHLQFVTDASSEVVVSWHTLQPVSRARVLLGEQDAQYRRRQSAQQSSWL